MEPGQTWTPLPQGPGAAGATALAEPFPRTPAARCDGRRDTCPLGCQTGAGVPGTWAVSCSVLPEEPLELGCRDRWSCHSGRMINSFNYTLRWACQCRAQPGGPAGMAQLARSQLPRALWGWACPGGGSPGARPRRCLPGGRDRSQQHPRVWGGLGTPAAEAAPLPSLRHPARPEHAAPILPACLPGSPAASPVWRREELRLAALAAICTSRLWGRVAAPALRSPRAMGNPAGGWQEAGERLAVTSTLPRAAQPARPWERDGLRGCSLGKALCHARPPALLGHRGPRREPAPLAPGTHMDTGSALPGTTPLVAIALMEMAVSIVCGKKHSVGTRQSSLPTGKGELGTCGDLGLPGAMPRCATGPGRLGDSRVGGRAGRVVGWQRSGGLSPLEGPAAP